MFYSGIIWDEEDDPQGNVQHVAEHDLTVEDVEEILAAPESEGHSKSTGHPAVWGHVPDGRFIIVVFEAIDEDTIRVITAYEVPNRRQNEKGRRSHMTKKPLKRIYRSGKLSAEQAARDEEIRRQVQAEFPRFEGESAGRFSAIR